jgi:hypothetical protein
MGDYVICVMRETADKPRKGRMSDQSKSWTKEWLACCHVTDSIAGDVIMDMRRDPDLPPLFRNLEHMRDYLRLKQAPKEAIKALPAIWRRYSRWLARNPTGAQPRRRAAIPPPL